MPTFLTASAQLEATRKAFDRARSAAAKAPHDKAKAAAVTDLAAKLTAAYQTAITAAADSPALAKQRDTLIDAKVIHHEKYEKKTIESPDKEPKSEPASGAEAAPETAPSEEEEPSSSMPASGEEEGGTARKAKRAEDDEEEEKAIDAAYTRATASYRREMRDKNVDAYGAKYGPTALLSACMKALGTTSIRETFGALVALPDKLAASAEVDDRVAKLEQNDRKSRVDAIVAKAKAEGRTQGAEHRAKLRAFGMKNGTSELKGMIAMLPAKRTTAQGFRDADEEEAANVGAKRGSASMAQVSEADLAIMTAGMPAAEAAQFREDFAKALANNGNVKAPAV